MRRPPWLWIAAAAILATAAIIAIDAHLGSPASTHTVALGDPIRQDDFTYTVAGYLKTPTVGLGPDRMRAKGQFYVVTILVDNHAKVVAFRWDPSIAQLVDARGTRYEFSAAAQRALDGADVAPPVVYAGESRKFLVVFDLPNEAVHPSVAFSNGILMGDMFDFGSYARARVPLE